MKPAIIRPDLNLKSEIKQLPLRNLLYIRQFGEYNAIDYVGCMQRLHHFIEEQKLTKASMAPYCIYYNDPKTTDPGKLCTDIGFTLTAPVKPAGEIGFKQIPEGRYLTFLYQGSYDHLQAVYDTIFSKYLPESGCTLRDEPCSECYLNDPACTAPDDLLTEIHLPIE